MELRDFKPLGIVMYGSVTDPKGKSIPSSVRTSQGTFLPRAYDVVVDRVERRVAQVTHLPVTHQESLQILRYKPGEQYEAHFDWFNDAVSGPGAIFLRGCHEVIWPLNGGNTEDPRSIEFKGMTHDPSGTLR